LKSILILRRSVGMNKILRFSLLVMSVVLFAGGSVFAKAGLELSENSFDFGYVPQKVKVTHVFWIHSTGTDTLKIEKISPGCGCTKAPLESDVIAPGDSARLEIIYDTEQYRGKQKKFPNIISNADKSARKFEFTADVITDPEETKPVVIKPYKFDISQFGKAVRRTLKFQIANISNEDLNITIVDYPQNMFSISMPNTVPAGGTIDGSIVLTDEYVDREFNCSITIELSDQLKTRFTIPVERLVRIPGVGPTGK